MAMTLSEKDVLKQFLPQLLEEARSVEMCMRLYSHLNIPKYPVYERALALATSVSDYATILEEILLFGDIPDSITAGFKEILQRALDRAGSFKECLQVLDLAAKLKVDTLKYDILVKAFKVAVSPEDYVTVYLNLPNGDAIGVYALQVAMEVAKTTEEYLQIGKDIRKNDSYEKVALDKALKYAQTVWDYVTICMYLPDGHPTAQAALQKVLELSKAS